MNEKILERLLIDRALGGLAPDVAALLEAYLDKDPGPAGLRREIDETVRLAGSALPRPPLRALPPPKFVAFPRRSRAAAHPWRQWWPVELAAVFVAGLMFGLWSSRPPLPPASRPDPGQTIALQMPAGSESGTASFWSTARVAELQSKSPAPTPSRIAWLSPVRKPQLIQ
jgi:hypothetical protein